MHTVTFIHTRKDITVPFFAGSPESAVLLEQLRTITEAAPGFVSKSQNLSTDKFVSVMVYNWESLEAYTLFVNSNRTLLQSIKQARKIYNQQFNITTRRAG